MCLDDIECDLSDPIFNFSIPIYTEEIVCSSECNRCDYCDYCNLPNIGDERDDDDDEFELNLKFKFEFASRYFDKYAQSDRDERKKIEDETKREQKFEKQYEKGVKHEQELVKAHETQKTAKNKEETTMVNNIFNINMEFGPNKDENIASTIMGIAVKNGDNWRIYDKKKKEITDVGNMQLGNLPIFILPTTKLSEGDLIKDDGEYYFVMKVDTGSTQTLCAKTGEMKTVIPIKNVLGFSCYMKVIALSDSLNLNIEDDFDVEKLAIMSAMYNQSGENSAQMNQLLPLLLFKDKLSGDDDIKNLLLMSYMMPAQTKDGVQNGTINQLLPLMLFKDKIGKDDDMMKLLLISSMTGGNMTDSNSPLVSYLMLDSFINTNDKKNSNQDSNDD